MTGDRAGRVEVLSLEQLAAADPEVIVFVPCGYDLERGARELLQTPLLQSEGAHGCCGRSRWVLRVSRPRTSGAVAQRRPAVEQPSERTSSSKSKVAAFQAGAHSLLPHMSHQMT